MKTTLLTLAIYVSFIEPTIPTVESPTHRPIWMNSPTAFPTALPTLSPSVPTIVTTLPTTELPTKQSILLHVKTMTGAIFSFNFETDRTIMYVKKQIKKELDIPVEQQTLVYERERLENMKTLDAYNIQYGSTLYLIRIIK
eukprot:366092_1